MRIADNLSIQTNNYQHGANKAFGARVAKNRSHQFFEKLSKYGKMSLRDGSTNINQTIDRAIEPLNHDEITNLLSNLRIRNIVFNPIETFYIKHTAKKLAKLNGEKYKLKLNNFMKWLLNKIETVAG